MDKPPQLDNGAAIRLLRRIGQGDGKAFVELFRAINRSVFLFAQHRLGDRHDAEEVLNDTAMELWRHPERFRGDSKFITYVLGIANHKAIGVLRHRGRREEDPVDNVEDVPGDDPTPFDAAWGNERLAAILRCMDQLPERQRTVVHLAYFEDLSREEIGRIIGCEGNAVRQHLWQALRKLKPCIATSGLN
jgi:RNA polymerase sigma-70 factor (ECF subfamily)